LISWVYRTDNGGLNVCPEDWIVTHKNGEKVSIKPDLFLKNYTPIKEKEK